LHRKIVVVSLIALLICCSVLISNAYAEPKEKYQVIRTGNTVKALDVETGSYAVVEKWMYFWFICYGADIHLHLSAIDAINLDTALTTIPILLTLISAACAATITGLPVAAVGACLILITSALKYNYHTIYATDANADQSFDCWTSVSFYSPSYIGAVYMGLLFEFVLTNRYLWLVTILGAYILHERNNPPHPSGTHGGGGGKARMQ